MKRKILLIAVVFALLAWACTKNDNQTQNLSLKQAVETNVADINSAIASISQTKGYQILTTNTASVAKSLSDSFSDSITLAKVAGVYAYSPDTVFLHHNFAFPFRLFKKTGSSDKMIVSLPQKLIMHPKYLHSFIKSDSVLVNDFTITASNYHLYYNSWKSLDYKLTAGLMLSSADLGSFDVSSVSKSRNDQSSTSQYTFTGGYKISTSWQSGDTSKITFALLKDNSQLLTETTLFTGGNYHKFEKQYDLVIGNVEIKRGFGIDSIQVFQNGVLQKTAGAKITDSNDNTGTICNKRDILLTFDDGTTAKLSELIGPSLTELKTLVTSLRGMFFAENIIDYIALNIYYNSR
jgi:hypothetical protein